MKVYVMTTGALFGLLTVAHLLRMVAETAIADKSLGVLLITAATAALCVWSSVCTPALQAAVISPRDDQFRCTPAHTSLATEHPFERAVVSDADVHVWRVADRLDCPGPDPGAAGAGRAPRLDRNSIRIVGVAVIMFMNGSDTWRVRLSNDGCRARRRLHSC